MIRVCYTNNTQVEKPKSEQVSSSSPMHIKHQSNVWHQQQRERLQPGSLHERNAQRPTLLASWLAMILWWWAQSALVPLGLQELCDLFEAIRCILQMRLPPVAGEHVQPLPVQQLVHRFQLGLIGVPVISPARHARNNSGEGRLLMMVRHLCWVWPTLCIASCGFRPSSTHVFSSQVSRQAAWSSLVM